MRQRERSCGNSACPSDVLALSLAVSGGHVAFQDTDTLHCLDNRTGQPVWRIPCAASLGSGGWAAPTLVINDGVVLSSDRQRLVAVDADSGRSLWESPASEGFHAPGDVFVINNTVWIWRYTAPVAKATWQEVDRAADTTGRFEARDLHTGALQRTVHMPQVWTAGHHHRCYRNKATSRFLVIGKRGIELVDLNGEEHSRNNWVRGVCQYGVLPCNGLLYAPPHACRCSIQAQLNGFYALAPSNASPEAFDQSESGLTKRLERGPAFADPALLTSNVALPTSSDWPTLRHDPARSGATPTVVPHDLGSAWCRALGGRLSQPVVADGRLYVAQVDAHTVHALDAEDGDTIWTFTAGGRVDSPPTVCGNRVVFGAHDGWVYCVRATDGVLIWRFRAAPHDRRIVDNDQVSSVWPVHGSVLVRETSDGRQAYFAAGRSGHLDHGVSIYGLDLATGELRAHRRLSMPHPRGDEQTDRARAHTMPGVFPDILVSHDDHIHMRHTRFDSSCHELEAQRDDALLAQSGFLDQSGFFRSHWQRGAVRGQLLVLDKRSTYGVRSGYQIQPWLLATGHQHFDRYTSREFPRGSLVFAASTGGDPQRGTPSPDWSFPSRGEKGVRYRWSLRAPCKSPPWF